MGREVDVLTDPLGDVDETAIALERHLNEIVGREVEAVARGQEWPIIGERRTATDDRRDQREVLPVRWREIEDKPPVRSARTACIVAGRGAGRRELRDRPPARA